MTLDVGNLKGRGGVRGKLARENLWLDGGRIIINAIDLIRVLYMMQVGLNKRILSTQMK